MIVQSNKNVGHHHAEILRPSRADVVSERLAQVGLFAVCTKRELKSIAKAAIVEQSAAGSTLVSEGDEVPIMYVILQGRCRVVRKGRRVAEIGPGGVVGELSILTKSVRNATVVAETPLEVAVLGRKEFFTLLEKSPSFSRKLLETLATRIQELDAKSLS